MVVYLFLLFRSGVLIQWKHGWQTNPDMMRTTPRRPQFRRALFIIGLLLRHFDFTDLNVIQGLPVNIISVFL